MKDTITVYETWSQLTVGQYEELLLIQREHPKDSAKYIVEYLYGIEDADRLPIAEYSCYVAGLRRFMEQPIPQAKLTPNVSYTLNGRPYRVDITPTAFTVAQYTDLTNYLKREATLTDLLSVVVVPDGRDYNDGYDMEQVRSDLASMPLEAGFAVVNFFGKWSKASIRTFLRFLTKQTKMGKVSPEKMKMLEAEVETLLRLMASPPTC